MSTKHFITYKRYEEKHGIGEYRSEYSKVPPQFVLDKIADEAFTGKFNTKRKNLCNTCYEFKSSNGTCSCSDLLNID